MQPEYSLLAPNHALPSVGAKPFLAILIADERVPDAWRNQIAEWLIANGCLYFVAWGVDCEVWHDSVDWANLEAHGFGDIPDDRFVMTTWHDKESLSEALWFGGNCASHPDVELKSAHILHVASKKERARVLEAFRTAQEITDT
ncbi:DUF7684 family protein [Novosphingobium subterraneum]|uniref:DUF7684 family protein n=1 Tax=Novosphingobium subterraneum TaxID=48936 RepID=UPI003D02AAF1